MSLKIAFSRTADVIWLDYDLWGAVKDKCDADKPEIIDALKNNIREAIGEIQLHCMASRGHLTEIIFHYSPEWLYF